MDRKHSWLTLWNIPRKEAGKEMNRALKALVFILIIAIPSLNVFAEEGDINPDPYVSQTPWSISYKYDGNKDDIKEFNLSSVVNLLDTPLGMMAIGVYIHKKNSAVSSSCSACERRAYRLFLAPNHQLLSVLRLGLN